MDNIMGSTSAAEMATVCEAHSPPEKTLARPLLSLPRLLSHAFRMPRQTPFPEPESSCLRSADWGGWSDGCGRSWTLASAVELLHEI